MQNWLDMIYVTFSILTIFHHITYHPFTFESKCYIIISIVMNCLRSFKYLRIFECFGPIVYMISKVMIDLRYFMLFYGILIVFFSMVMSVIGLANSRRLVNYEYYKYSFKCKIDTAL